MPYVESQPEFENRQDCCKIWDEAARVWRFENGSSWSPQWKRGSDPPSDCHTLAQACYRFYQLKASLLSRRLYKIKETVAAANSMFKRYPNPAVAPVSQADLDTAESLGDELQEAQEQAEYYQQQVLETDPRREIKEERAQRSAEWAKQSNEYASKILDIPT